jgi:hypothetical protein
MEIISSRANQCQWQAASANAAAGCESGALVERKNFAKVV